MKKPAIAKHAQETSAKSATFPITVSMVSLGSITIPPEASVVPQLTPEVREALVESIRERGIETPLKAYFDGRCYVLISGRHRFQCAQMLGLRDVPLVVVPRPADLRRTIVEEAVVSRDLPKLGRAALLLEVIPALADRKDKRGNPNGRNGDSVPIPTTLFKTDTDEVTIRATAQRFGIDKTYFQTLIAARAECRDTNDWNRLKDLVSSEPMGASRVMSALRGIQSGGANDETHVAGRAGADVDKLAMKTPATLSTIFRRWGNICDASQSAFMVRFRDALKVLPPDGHVVIRDSVKDWPDHECRELQKAVDARVKALDKERKA